LQIIKFQATTDRFPTHGLVPPEAEPKRPTRKEPTVLKPLHSVSDTDPLEQDEQSGCHRLDAGILTSLIMAAATASAVF